MSVDWFYYSRIKKGEGQGNIFFLSFFFLWTGFWILTFCHFDLFFTFSFLLDRWPLQQRAASSHEPKVVLQSDAELPIGIIIAPNLRFQPAVELLAAASEPVIALSCHVVCASGVDPRCRCGDGSKEARKWGRSSTANILTHNTIFFSDSSGAVMCHTIRMCA